MTARTLQAAKRPAEIVREYGPFADVKQVGGVTWDGERIWAATGQILATIPAPGGGRDSGLAWAEGTLWVGQHRERKIHQIDPETGAILRTLDSNRFVTGVTWVDGELWHGVQEGGESDVRRIDPATGEILEQLDLPAGFDLSGLESDGDDQFFCGGAASGRLLAVSRPRRAAGR